MNFQGSFLSDKSKDISSEMSPVKNQGNLGTCATFSSVALVEKYIQKDLSEECLLRYRGGFQGDMTKDVLNDISKYGLVEEKKYKVSGKTYDCVYDDSKEKEDISKKQYQELSTAGGHFAKGFHLVHENDTQVGDDYYPPNILLGDGGKSFDYIKSQIDNGNPVVIGVVVPQSKDETKSFQGGDGKHVIDMTKGDNCSGKPLHEGDNFFEVGCPGHAIVLTGYDDAQKYFVFKNSWGTKWGYEGYGKLSYDYLANYRVSTTSVIEK